MIIAIATLEDLENLVDHDIRHLGEYGHNNLPSHPFPKGHSFDRDRMIDRNKSCFSTEIGQIGWGRSFLLIEHNKILGHLSLKNEFSGTLHRAKLGMGIEMSMRGKGGGKLLMKTALNWAREQDFIEWIDLSVFDHNLPAKKLYSSFGFQELYTIKDLFRVEGISIDDVQMVLKLK